MENGIKLCNELLGQKNDNIALLKKAVDMQEDFLELAEDMSEVDTFFRVQRSIFDNARSQVERVNEEKKYFRQRTILFAVVEKIKQIIATQKPYKRISELPELIQTVQEDYQKLLSQKREEVIGEIQAAMGEIHQTADIKQGVTSCRGRTMR